MLYKTRRTSKIRFRYLRVLCWKFPRDNHQCAVFTGSMILYVFWEMRMLSVVTVPSNLGENDTGILLGNKLDKLKPKFVKSAADICMANYHLITVPLNKNGLVLHLQNFMMTSSNGNIFHVTDLLCGEFTGPRWIPLTKTIDAERWCFLWSAPE